MTQLINKTNQFNLTTQRRSRGRGGGARRRRAPRCSRSPSTIASASTASIGVTIGRQSVAGCELDTVLMSCRVLGRGVETAILAETVARARADRPGAGHRPLPADRPQRDGRLDLLPDHGFAATPRGDEMRPRADIPAPCRSDDRRSPHTSPSSHRDPGLRLVRLLRRAVPVAVVARPGGGARARQSGAPHDA